MEISTKTSFMNTSAEHFHSQWWTSNRETACREQRSRVIPRPAEKRDHQDCRTQACHCRPTLLCTYHTSTPHHMNRSHHPPLPLQQKMLWGHAPLLCARHSAWTGREQNHSGGHEDNLRAAYDERMSIMKENTWRSSGVILVMFK